MRLYPWATVLALFVCGCGDQAGQPTRPVRPAKSDLFGQIDQLKTIERPNVMVSQYASCDQSCVNQVDDPGLPDAIRGASDGCCTSFSPEVLTGQMLGTPGACPAGFNPVSTQTEGGPAIACQVLAGGHVFYIPKDCDPFADNADDSCPGDSTCGIDGYCTGEIGREMIDYANQAQRLHPELTQGSSYHAFNGQLTGCNPNSTSELCTSGVDDVFASQWWPQSENGIAWRWQPQAVQGFENTSDVKTMSPAEKYDLLLGDLSTGCAASEMITVAGRTFCPVKVNCGSNRCENAAGQSVACNAADAKYCVNYSWRDRQDGCPDNPEEGVTCSPIKNELVKVVGPATKWELENHGNYQYTAPDGWWGHCNGWASYATAEALKYPKEDICVRIDDSGAVTRCTSDPAAVQQCGDVAGTEGCVLFRMGDIEALMSELYFSDAATFTGRRCNALPEDIEEDEFSRPKNVECRDINAGTFHVAVTGMLGEGVTPFLGGNKTKLPFVIDHNWDYQVWNFPLVKFQFTSVIKLARDGSNCPTPLPTAAEAEASGDTQLAEMLRTQPLDRVCAARLVALASNGDYSKFNPHPETSQYAAVTMNYWMVSDGVGAWAMMKRADQRGVSPHRSEMNYVLEIDGEDNIRGGEWTKNPSFEWGQDNKKAHPDFLWAAIKPSANSDDTDLTDSDNSAINYQKVKALLLCANDGNSCGRTTPPPPNPGTTNVCADHCGGSVTIGSNTCYCDEGCTNYGDCCQGAAGTAGPDYAYVDEGCGDGGGDTPPPADNGPMGCSTNLRLITATSGLALRFAPDMTTGRAGGSVSLDYARTHDLRFPQYNDRLVVDATAPQLACIHGSINDANCNPASDPDNPCACYYWRRILSIQTHESNYEASVDFSGGFYYFAENPEWVACAQ